MITCENCSKALQPHSDWGTKGAHLCFGCSMVQRDRQGKTLD